MKKYYDPEIELIKFDTADITNSDDDDFGDGEGGDIGWGDIDPNSEIGGTDPIIIHW